MKISLEVVEGGILLTLPNGEVMPFEKQSPSGLSHAKDALNWVIDTLGLSGSTNTQHRLHVVLTANLKPSGTTQQFLESTQLSLSLKPRVRELY